MLKRTTVILLVSIWAAMMLLTGCSTGSSGQGEELNSKEFFAMDTYMEIRGYEADDELLEEGVRTVQNLEKLLSTTRADSEIARINAAGTGTVTWEAEEVLSAALDLCALTEGSLDISIYPVVKAWGFTTEEYRIPADSEISGLLEKVDFRRIDLSENGTVALDEGMEIDLGAVAKGYAGDLLGELFRSRRITSALFSLGGNVQCLGSKPDGSPWKVAIQDPQSEGVIGVLPVIGQAVVTSGGYERYFEGPDGETYWHIMDPATGRPAKNGLISVTIIGESGLRCDALSTALFIMGEEKALSFWREHREHDMFDMVLVTEDNRILITEGIAGDFVPEDGMSYTIEEID